MTDYPKRPNHPDFWLMAEAVQDLDSAADDKVSFDRLVSPFVDMESLTYVAEQRALRLQRSANPFIVDTEQRTLIQLQASWVDGFIAGQLYQKYKTERGEG